MKVRIFAGSGGVGKTSVAAASALRTAIDGGRCLVLTIDPAARLKTALGMGTGGEQVRVPLDGYATHGELWAAQLDVKAAFEQMVRRMARPERLEAVLNHPLYRALGSLAGMDELMAVERIGRALVQNFDSIVIDTAPSRHALDFLDKPEYLASLVSAPMVKLVGRTWKLWDASPLGKLGRAGLDLFGEIEKLVGAQLTRDVLEFFAAFQGVAEAYAREAEKTILVLRDPTATAFTVVSTPFKAATDAGWFLSELHQRRFAVERLIVNRVWPALDVSAKPGAGEEASALVNWYHRVSSEQERATEAVKRECASRIPGFTVLRELSADIDGIPALGRLAESLSS